MERGWKPNVEICPPCPRCGSSNTKFCYYNNYSLTQPRYFCKGCRRYWTKGGSLRNIPVGGGCRKTRRAKSLHIRDTASSQSFLAGSYVGSGNIETSGGKGGMVQPTNIDLQEVYANFLNQRPDQVVTHQEHMQAQVLLPNEVPPMSSFGFTSMDFGATNFGSNLESLLSEGSGMQFCGYNSIFNNHEEQEKQYFGTSGVSNCGLPPLPGEELGWPETNIGFSGNDSGECSVKMFDLPASSDTIFRP